MCYSPMSRDDCLSDGVDRWASHTADHSYTISSHHHPHNPQLMYEGATSSRQADDWSCSIGDAKTFDGTRPLDKCDKFGMGADDPKSLGC